MELISTDSFVEVPFILVRIGNNTFGGFKGSSQSLAYSTASNVKFPNYMKSINIRKINGTVNQYSIKMSYQITAGDDPNLLEKVFSSVGYGDIYITYGDWNCPTNIYKEEKALITGVKSNVNVGSSRIEYTIECISSGGLAAANTYNFSAREAKGSDVIKEILYKPAFGLTKIFTGMANKSKVLTNNLIKSDDKIIHIEPQINVSPLSYLNYVTNSMSASTNKLGSAIKDSIYALCIVDDIRNIYGGPYFEVKKVNTVAAANAASTWEIDIGYPGSNMVTNFSINSDNTWALLYEYTGDIKESNYSYSINNQGIIETKYSPSITTNNQLKTTTQAGSTWWTKMTQFPINATLTIKGLIRPTILMDYVRLNVLFYGQQHVSSGLYFISKQEDTIDAKGYRTVLTLTRIKEK